MATTKTRLSATPGRASLAASQQEFQAASRAARAGADVGFAADQEATFIWPGTVNAYQAGWALIGDPKVDFIFKKCREERGHGGFVEMLLYYKQIVFCDGLKFTIDGLTREQAIAQKNKQIVAWFDEHEDLLHCVTSDFVSEFLLCDNAAILWMETDGAPELMVPDCENVDYKKILGAEELKIKLPKMKLSDNNKRELGSYATALESGKMIPWGEVSGGQSTEHFAVRTRGKINGGFVKPRMFSVFTELSTLDLLRKGDWNAAWRSKDVIRKYSRGHEIKNGPLAGQPIHFLKTKQAKKIRDELKTKEGVFDLVTNWDAVVSFAFLDPKVFDDIKTKGVMRRLREWAGPLAILLCEENNQPSEYWVKILDDEVGTARSDYRRTLEKVFNDPTFFKGAAKAPGRIQVAFNPNTLTTLKMILEKLRLGGGNGYIAPQTAREEMGYDSDREGTRLKEAAKDRDAYTPPFEAKQGMVSGTGPRGGRPEGATGSGGAE